MKRIFSYTITAQDSDQRIYDFLCHHGYSRHIRTWLKQHPGSVRLNDKEALFYFPLKTGDLLEITLEEEQPSDRKSTRLNSSHPSSSRMPSSA